MLRARIKSANSASMALSTRYYLRNTTGRSSRQTPQLGRLVEGARRQRSVKNGEVPHRLRMGAFDARENLARADVPLVQTGVLRIGNHGRVAEPCDARVRIFIGAVAHEHARVLVRAEGVHDVLVRVRGTDQVRAIGRHSHV